MFRIFLLLWAAGIFCAALAEAAPQPANAAKTRAVPAAKKAKDAADVPAGKSVFEMPLSAPSREQPYALNVVYFVPADMEPFPEYERRISEIMLSLQKFYGEEMARNGFPNRTFGLRKSKDGKSVDIVTVKGKKNGADYPYAGSAGTIIAELDEYFSGKNADKKFSDHTLIIMPSTSGDAMNPGGVPFYGYGKNCFALDYPLYDLKFCGKNDPVGRLFTKWYGGMAHELGHGLNLPHNSGKVSDDEKLGTALMGAGNYTLGLAPTFLTRASASILDCCQVFRTTKMPKKPAPPVNELKELVIRFGAGGVRVSGVLPAKNRVEHVLVYYDKDECNGVNEDYDAESFVADFDRKTRTFSVAVPAHEIHPGRTGVFQIRLRLINDDGTCAIVRCTFDEATKRDLIVPENSKLAELEPPPPVKKKTSRKKKKNPGK